LPLDDPFKPPPEAGFGRGPAAAFTSLGGPGTRTFMFVDCDDAAVVEGFETLLTGVITCDFADPGTDTCGVLPDLTLPAAATAAPDVAAGERPAGTCWLL